MKRNLVTILLLIIWSTGWADEFSRKLEWSVKTIEYPASNKVKWPVFSTASKNSENALPRYYELLPVDATVASVRLTNVVFAPAGAIGETECLLIPEELELNQHLYSSGNKYFAELEFIPFIRNENQLLRLVSFDIELQKNLPALKSAKSAMTWTANSVLASGKWVKIKTSGRGIYKITYDDLKTWGFSSPSEIKIYGNGAYQLPLMNNEPFFDDLRQNAVWHGKDGSNKDCVFFYSTGTVKWGYDYSLKMFIPKSNQYSDECFYYLSDAGAALTVQTASNPAGSAEKEISEYDFYSFHKKEEANLINSGMRFYGDRIYGGQEKVFAASEFGVSGRIESDTVKIMVDAVGRAESANKLNVSINNQLVGSVNFWGIDFKDTEGTYARPGSLRANKVYSGASVEIKAEYAAAGLNSEAWIDQIAVNARCRLQMGGDLVEFRDRRNVKNGGVMAYSVDQATAETRLWDVSDFTRPVEIPSEKNGSRLRFVVATDRLREFVAFNPKGTIPTAVKVVDVPNQNLHGTAVCKLLIIAPEEFMAKAEELAEFHREMDGMTVCVASTEQVYNEFSCGQADAAGIRNFVRMCYNNSEGAASIKYVLLLGDGSYDNKNILGAGFNKIPTYQTDDSLMPTTSFVSDDFFVLLDENEGGYSGLVDLGIGRIPARTVDEVDAVIQKIKKYVTPESLGDWRNVVCVISDDGNSEDRYSLLHVQQSEEIADLISINHPAFYTDKIYFDAFRRESGSGGASYPDVEEAIDRRVKEGALILNYIGHANDEFLADERVLDINKIDSWTNYKNLPIFVTATCEFSRFDENTMSAGEHILFNPNGGGIGLFSTTRLVYSIENFNLTKSFYNHVFNKDEEGKNLRMGDIMRLAKIGSNSGTNKRNFTLLADPALRLAYPQLQIETTTINGQNASGGELTISALNKVTVAGRVTNDAGGVQSDFNGTIIPVVYDKSMELETLGNAGQGTITFDVRDNVIYKGRVSVKNGEFSFSFVVPKDISYSIGNGKIMYYADNGQIDAQGAFSNFNIGGSSGSQISDNNGPEIKLYFNDESFKSGAKVGASPIMIARVSDESGINTVGTGIGHDITAILDGDNSKRIVLNSYYESDLDSHTSGVITYPFNDLEPGKHTVTLKVWDVLNNSSEATVEFVVTSDFNISEVKCYPNPATDYVYLSATHNLPDELFTATIELFDRSGKRITSIEKQLPSDGAQTVPIKWQTSDSGVVLTPGIYLVRFSLTSQKGYTGARTGKFIFLRK